MIEVPLWISSILISYNPNQHSTTPKRQSFQRYDEALLCNSGASIFTPDPTCPQPFFDTNVLLMRYRTYCLKHLKYCSIHLSSRLRIFSFLLLFPLLWGQSFLYRQSMDLFQLLLQCSIHHPMPLQQPLPFKLFWHNFNCKACTTPAHHMHFNRVKELREKLKDIS